MHVQLPGLGESTRLTPEGDCRLVSSRDAPHAFDVSVTGATAAALEREITVTGLDAASGETVTLVQRIQGRSHDAYLNTFQELARRFGTRMPRNRSDAREPDFSVPYRPLLTENLWPEVLHGYGDPAMIRVGDDRAADGVWYYLTATSNDAPDSFPIARSRDLSRWYPVGFVFPRGTKPAWAADGAHVSDYWAPEMHLVGGEYRVYFAARERDGHELAIGVATSPDPGGPFATPDAPVLRGDVIDPHVLLDEDGSALLFWKEDRNGLWPGLLNQLLHERSSLIPELFITAEDRRTASLLAAMWPWVRLLEPMERFFIQQILVEAVTANFAVFKRRLHDLLSAESDAEARRAMRAALDATSTPIHAQRLTPDGSHLIGERVTVLENDLEWEAHLIEGVWVTRQKGKYYLFYAGNDFSTASYGIGVAIAETALGPYRKVPEPLLRSTPEWWGPGHPSVALGPDGEPWLFLHAFHPGRTGYNEFRALLTVPISFDADRVTLR